MPIDYTTNSLISLIQLNISSQNSSARFSNNDYITFLNQELNNNIVPKIKSVNEEYFVTSYSFVPQANVQSYLIPTQAIGESLRKVSWIVTNSVGQTAEAEMRRLTIDDICLFSPGVFSMTAPIGNFYGYYIEGNNFILYPTPTVIPNCTVKLRYFRQPNNLVATSAAGQITSINMNTNTITLSNLPTSWQVGTPICSIGSIPPFQTGIESTNILSISNPSITITDVTGLSIGDWISYAGDSPIPQIPYSCYGNLVQSAIIKICQSIKDVTGLEIAQGILKTLDTEMEKNLSPRVSGEPEKRTSNGAGLGDLGRLKFFGWRR